MSATVQTSTPEAPLVPGSPSEPGPRAAASLGSKLNDVLDSLLRLAGLEVRIALANVRRAVLHMVLAVLFALLAVFFTFLALVFIYAGAYRLLTDVLHIPAVWALLIFAAAHLVLAGILATVAMSVFRGNRHTQQGSTR